MKEFIIERGIKAIIFDCDGTLVDSMPLHMRAWKETFKHFKTEYDEKYLFTLKGMKETEMVKSYNKKFGTRLDPEEAVSFKQKYTIRHLSEVEPIIPVVNIVKKYYGKIPLAVVSGSIHDIVDQELKNTEIFHLFNFVIAADDPYEPKPAPDIFFAAAEKLNVEPKFCLVFEDGDAGLEAAEHAGMKTIDIRKYI